MSTDPIKGKKVKECGLRDCLFVNSQNIHNEDEKVIATYNLCNDPACANVHEKKLVDLSQGLSQLENILSNMTGLCKDRSCPVNKNIKNEQKLNDSNATCSPCPATPIDKYKDLANMQATKQATSVKPPSYKQTFDAKICQGPVCCNAYMGYKFPAPEDKSCGSNTCTPKPKTPCKQSCGKPTCPYSQDPLLDWTSRSPLFTSSPINLKLDVAPNEKKPKTTEGPCGGFPCPIANNDLSSNTYKPLFDYKYPTNIKSMCISNFNQNYAEPCNIDICTLCNKQTEKEPIIPVGLCGRTSCPFASVENAEKLAAFDEKKPNTPINGATEQPNLCTNPTCPYAPNKENQQPTAPCGNLSCPHKTPQSGPAPVGLCGRTSCPFASIIPNVKAQPTALCGSPTCPFGQTTYQSVGPCGGVKCPTIGQTSPGATKPCPFAYQIKRYPCGSPSCPYVNPSGMLHTHEYGTDLSYVREAARPYCGSASPYDYLSSLDNSYPAPFATNYPLFPHTDPSPPPLPCPYFANRKKKKSCGLPTCPYGNTKEEEDNFCINSTCPFGTGICGGPKMYSCDSPDVEPCGSPDCKVQTLDRKKNKRRSSSSKRISDKVPRRNSTQKSGMRLDASTTSIYSNLSTLDYSNDITLDDVLFFDDDNKARASDCNKETCPYLKKLVFCDDCGGVLPDNEIPDIYAYEENYQSEENTPAYDTDNEEQINNKIEELETKIKSKTDHKTPVKEEEHVEKRSLEFKKSVSMYSYPGVQLGHKECIVSRKLIPSNMGWLWNCIPTFGNPDSWRGYKPGAISKKVFKIMKEHRKRLGLVDPTETLKKKKIKSRTKIEDLKHFIEVKKKDGDYTVVVNPVKDPKTRDPIGNPYMDVTPIQFKVEKEKIEKDPAYCPCDEISEDSVPSTICSQFEFHFTPPAAIPEAFLRKTKNMAVIETQYDINDLPPELRGHTGKKKSKSGKGGKNKGKGKKGKKGKK